MNTKIIKISILIFIFSFICIDCVNAEGVNERLKGKILLQVESNGEAWYVNPDNLSRYFLGRPSDAFNIMRELGLGISNKDFDSFNNIASERLSGKILIKVEDNGEAYYVNPDDLKMYYLSRPADAFQIMRELGLGITNNDLEKIKIKQEGDNETPLTITKVIDGDTVVIEGGEHVRLLGIDADEPGYPCYYDAKNRLEELVLGKEAILESDQTDKDQYDRLLRYIIISDININLELVKEGRAICRSYNPDTKYKDECSVLEQDAKNNKLGCKWEEAIATEPVCTVLTTEETGYDVVKAEDADNYIGTSKIVEGYVASTRKYSNPAIFLNLCDPYPNHCFVSIVWKNDWYKFPSNADSLYYDKTVRIKGYITTYAGKPEIIMDDPSDIEICK